MAAIERIGQQVWHLFVGPLVKALDASGFMSGARVVVFPQGGLGLLPLGLACDPQTGERLFERYELSLAPSVAALDMDFDDVSVPSLAAVVDPSGNLPFAPIERMLVETLFPPERRVAIHGLNATASAAQGALKAKTHWLFSCHATFNWSDPRLSGLSLTTGEQHVSSSGRQTL
jgi:CHAT domain-containing protein